MKKLISMLLVLTLCMMCMISYADEFDELIGDWYAYYFGNQMTLSFVEDGTASLDVDGIIVATGSWTSVADHYNVMLREDEDGPFYTEPVVITDDKLIFGVDYASVVYTREPAEKIEIADINLDAESVDFNGMWELYAVDMDGLSSAMTVNMDGVKVSIQDNVLNFESASKVGLFDLTEGDSMVLTYQDGMLMDAMEIDLGDENITVQFTCGLLTDGSLVFEINDGLNDTKLYFAPTDVLVETAK